MLFDYTFIEVEFIEDRVSERSKSKLDKPLQILINRLGKCPFTPQKERENLLLLF